MTLFLLLPVILLLAAGAGALLMLLVGGFVALVAAGKAVRALLPVGGAVLVFLAIAAVLAYLWQQERGQGAGLGEDAPPLVVTESARQKHFLSAQIEPDPVAQAGAEENQTPGEGPAWTAGGDSPLPAVPLLADAYPSAGQAMAALVEAAERRLRDEVRQAGVVAIRPPDEMPETGTAALLAALTGVLPEGTEIRLVRPGRPAPPEAVGLEFSAPGGILAVTARAPNGEVGSWATHIRPAAWLADLPAYLRENGQGHTVVASDLQAEEDRAFQQAAERAAAALGDTLQPALFAEWRRQRVPMELNGRELQRLSSQAADRLDHSAVLVDRYRQRFRRPYGQVTREILLIRTDPVAVRTLANRIVVEALPTYQAARGARRDRLNFWAALGLLGLILLAVYLVLNAATRGYYAWTLRLLAGGALIGVVALLLLSGRAP